MDLVETSIHSTLSSAAQPKTVAESAVRFPSTPQIFDKVAQQEGLLAQQMPVIELTPLGDALNRSSTVAENYAYSSRATPPDLRDVFTPPTAGPHRDLSSLLRYVDHDLMHYVYLHDRPSHSLATCSLCKMPWDHHTVFPIPGRPGLGILTPCNTPWRNTCCTCETELFELEGITTLTLATRTHLAMQETNPTGRTNYPSRPYAACDQAEYELECAAIDTIIIQQLSLQRQQLSVFSDRSPNLSECFYRVMQALIADAQPQSRWLQYSTVVGYSMFCILIGIKMRRYITESHAYMQGTEGWRHFENGMRAMQRTLTAQVHGS